MLRKSSRTARVVRQSCIELDNFRRPEGWDGHTAEMGKSMWAKPGGRIEPSAQGAGPVGWDWSGTDYFGVAPERAPRGLALLAGIVATLLVAGVVDRRDPAIE